MGKICKYANLYDKDGNLIHKVNEKGCLENYSMEELEILVDQLSQDYQRDGGAVTKYALDYANSLLLGMYMKYGNPHHDEIVEKLKAQYGNDKSTEELVRSALKDLSNDIENKERPETVMDEYIEPIEENGSEQNKTIE